MLVRKKSVIVTVAVAFSLLFATIAFAQTVTLTYRDLFSGADSDAMSALVERFNREHPNIKVERQLVQWENYYDQLQLAIAGGNAPDIAVVHTRWLPAFAARGALVPLDSYLPKSGIRAEDFLERAWEGTFYNGRQYGVPLDIIVSVVTFSNTDLMAQAGLAAPPSTGEELISFSAKVQQATGKWGTAVPLNGYIAFRNYFTTLYQNGGSIVTDDLKRANFNTPEGIEALQFWDDLIRKHKIAPAEIEDILGFFRLGNAAFVFTGIWDDLAFRNQEGLNYEVSVVPQFFKNRSFFGNSHNFVIPVKRNLDTNKIQAILTFVKWMTENTHDWGQVPAVKSVLNSDAVMTSVRGKVLGQLADLVYPPALIDIGRVETAIQEAVEAVLAGQKSAAQALREAEQEVNRVLSR